MSLVGVLVLGVTVGLLWLRDAKWPPRLKYYLGVLLGLIPAWTVCVWLSLKLLQEDINASIAAYKLAWAAAGLVLALWLLVKRWRWVYVGLYAGSILMWGLTVLFVWWPVPERGSGEGLSAIIMTAMFVVPTAMILGAGLRLFRSPEIRGLFR